MGYMICVPGTLPLSSRADKKNYKPTETISWFCNIFILPMRILNLQRNNIELVNNSNFMKKIPLAYKQLFLVVLSTENCLSGGDVNGEEDEVVPYLSR